MRLFAPGYYIAKTGLLAMMIGFPMAVVGLFWSHNTETMNLGADIFGAGFVLVTLDAFAVGMEEGIVSLPALGKWMVLVGTILAVFGATKNAIAWVIIGVGIFMSGAVLMGLGAVITAITKPRRA